jgi:hypothetical protein
MLTVLFSLVTLTGTIQLLLWRDKKRAARLRSAGTLETVTEGSSSPELEGSDVDGKRVVRTISKDVTLS